MAPRLRVLAGTSPSTMVPITEIVNTSKSHHLSSPLFEGEVVAHIKGMTDEKGTARDSEYFEREDRKGVTWSIQVQGRFLVPYSADDILFGNTFDRPLKLPWGTSAVLKFMHYIDPTLEHDLTSSSKPWALSPLISTMPHFMHTRLSPSSLCESGAESISGRAHSSSVPANGNRVPFPTPYSMVDATSELYLALADDLPLSPSHSPSGSTSSLSSTSSGISVPIPSTSDTSAGAGTNPSLLTVPKLLSSLSASSSKSSLSSGSFKSMRSKGSGTSIGIGSLRLKDAMKKVKRRRSISSMEAQVEREKELRALDGASQRRSYFAQRERRKDVVFGPEDLITTDFCYGFINFAPSLSLQVPGGLSFDLMRYWDGQPVRFVCCERLTASGHAEDGSSEPWGRIFWCVAIEVVDDGYDDDLGVEEKN